MQASFFLLGRNPRGTGRWPGLGLVYIGMMKMDICLIATVSFKDRANRHQKMKRAEPNSSLSSKYEAHFDTEESHLRLCDTKRPGTF